MTQLALKLNNINYSYPDGYHALHHISLEINEGEKVAIIGQNGAGKSTLLFYSACLLNQSDGIEIFGIPYNKYNEKAIREKIGFLFQEPDDQIFCLKALDEVAFGPLNLGLTEPAAEKKAIDALQILDLGSCAGRLCSHLSYGVKKSVCIASIIACSPEIIFLDEPTANLDLRKRRHLIDFFQTLDKTQIIATHDLHFALDVAGRTIIMDGGHIVADGKTREIISNEELLLGHGLELPPGIR